VKKYLISLILLSGCAVGPDYKPPENTVSDTWASSQDANLVSEQPPLTLWWEVFHDELLNRCIAKAIENNNDILTAESNILQARALRQVAASSFFPQIGADVNATRTYFSKNGPIFAIGPSTGSLPGTVSPGTGLPFELQVPQTQNLYNVLFDASWEIDFFGKTRRTVEAADANIGRSIEERNDILVSVLAEIARNYIEMRSLQQKTKLIKENIALLEQKSAIVEKEFEVGYASSIDVENNAAQLSSEKALLPDIEAEIYQMIYTISVLTGELPEALLEEMLPPRPLPTPPSQIAVGLRSDLLRRRPDVRKAERELAIATAYIGVAVASFFPTFTLIGDAGLQSLALNNLFTAGSRTWAFAGDVNMPIFQGGKLMGNLKAKKAETAAAAHTYQQTVLSALEETESALKAYTQSLQTIQEREDASTSYEKLTFLSDERYKKGLVSKIALIDTEREWNSSEQSLLLSETGSLLSLISLYKALGGGWEIEEQPTK